MYNKKQIDKKTTILSVNQGIYSILYGGRYGYITKIEGEQKPETITSLFGGVGVMGGNANIFIRFSNGNETSVPECIVRGVQWEIYDILNDNEIKEIDEKYYKAIEERKIKEELKDKKDKEEHEFYLNKYSSYLIQPKDNKKGAFDCVKQNIRIELKKEFPSIKFSVSSDHYGTVNVKWDDGPTIKEVQNITSKYEDHETDYTGDFRDYNPSNFNNIFGGCNYVFENRSMSEETQKKLYDWAENKFNNDETYNCRSFEQLARNLFNHYQIIINNDFTIEKTNVECGLNSVETFYKFVNNNVSNNVPTLKTNSKNDSKNVQVSNENISFEGLNLIDYSEKAFAITGNTYQYKDIFSKEFNGKFNKFLTCGAGWIFPKTKLNDIKTKFNII